MDGKRILLVEDDFLNRRLTKKVLQEKGVVVFEAKNTNEALEVLQHETIDVAILDINLGDQLEGLVFGQHLKNNTNVPFLYLTAYENTEIIKKAIATSPISYLTKPFKNVDLLASVRLAFLNSDTIKEIPSLVVKDGVFQVKIAIEDIHFIVCDGNYLQVHTLFKSYKYRSTIKQALEQLPPETFIQTHRAFIVNKNKITMFTLTNVAVNETVIPISKSFADAVLAIKFNL